MFSRKKVIGDDEWGSISNAMALKIYLLTETNVSGLRSVASNWDYKIPNYLELYVVFATFLYVATDVLSKFELDSKKMFGHEKFMERLRLSLISQITFHKNLDEKKADEVLKLITNYTAEFDSKVRETFRNTDYTKAENCGVLGETLKRDFDYPNDVCDYATSGAINAVSGLKTEIKALLK